MLVIFIAIFVYEWGAYAIAVFDQHVVIATDSDQEEYHLHVVEDVDPLLAFRSLSTNIEHAVCEVTSVKDGLADAGGAETCAQNVLVGRQIVFGEEPVDVGEVTFQELACAERKRHRFETYYVRLSCSAYSLPFLIASCTPSSRHRLLKELRQSNGIGSSAPISGSAATTSAKRCNSVSGFPPRLRYDWYTHNVAVVGEVHLLLFHGTKDDLERMQQILEDGDLPLFTFW